MVVATHEGWQGPVERGSQSSVERGSQGPVERGSPSLVEQGAGVLGRLRRDTRRLHDAIEKVVPIGIAHGGYRDYILYLKRLWGFHTPIETALRDMPGVIDLGIDLSIRQKTPLITHDLVFAGLTPSEIRALPVCSLVPRATAMPFALGMIYVLEGAMLGGQLLYRVWCRRYVEAQESARPARLNCAADMTPPPIPMALAFLRGYGDETRMRWGEVTSALGRFDGNELATSQIVEGARRTFATLGAWLLADERPLSATGARL